MGEIRDEIIKQLKGAINTQLSPSMNKALAKTGGVTEIYPGIDLDWSLPQAPTINSKELELGMKGLFFAADGGEVEPTDQPPKMPYHDDTIKSQF